MAAARYAEPIVTASKKTPKGRTVTIQLYVYPDGHGNVVVQDANLPVGNSVEAHGLFAEAWELLRA